MNPNQALIFIKTCSVQTFVWKLGPDSDFLFASVELDPWHVFWTSRIMDGSQINAISSAFW